MAAEPDAAPAGPPEPPASVEVCGKSYATLADGDYDCIMMGTGLKECVLAGLLAVRGKRVLQIDRNAYYGGACASLNLEELFKQFGKDGGDAAQLKERFGRPRSYCVDLVPKLLMANGKLVKMLLQTGVTRYMEFNGIAGSYVLNTGKIYKVPVTPKEALGTSLVGFFQKRNLRNFAEFMRDYDPPPPCKAENMPLPAVLKGIREYYETHNPEKLADVEALVPKYEGRFGILIGALEAKYGYPVFPSEQEVEFGPGTLGLRIEARDVAGSDPKFASTVTVIGFATGADGTPGPGQASGKIVVGDHISKVNGQSVLGMQDRAVQKLIVESPRPITLSFIKPIVPSKQGQDDLRAMPMSALYEKYGLDANSQNFIGHAMALRTDDTYLREPASKTVEAVKLYGRSVGLYGQDSPYLYPMYGLSSLPEGFSRLAAIYGGTVMLRTEVDEVLRDPTTGSAIGIRVGEQAARAPIIIGDSTYFKPDKTRVTGRVVRSICLLRHPVSGTQGDSAQIIMPAKHLSNKRHDVYISCMSYSHQVCPQNIYIAIASTTVETADPYNELKAAFKLLEPIEERFDTITETFAPVEGKPEDGCFITTSLDATSHFETAALDIMEVYEQITGEPLDLEAKLVPDQ